MWEIGLQVLILSYFDTKKGPTLFFSCSTEQSEHIPSYIMKKITNLLDLFQQDQFFIQSVEIYRTYNYFFQIPSKWARGLKELILISFIHEKTENELDIIEQFLKQCSNDIIAINDVYKAFYLINPERTSEEVKEIAITVYNMCESFLDNLPRIESFNEEKKQNKIVFVGLASTGKTSLINFMKNRVFNENTVPTIVQNITRFVLNNVAMTIFDIPGHESFHATWKNYLSRAKVIIFVIDSSNPNFSKTQVAYNLVLSIVKGSSTSGHIFLILNKQDLPDAMNESELRKGMKIQEKNADQLTVMAVSAKTGEGIDRFIEKLTEKLLEI